MDNNKVINQINQLFHNKGIKQENRFDLLLDLLEKNNGGHLVEAKYADILDLINAFDYANKDIIQELFMLFGNKLTKFKLDQFYTPLTISKFICQLMVVDENMRAIDPAGGTGDLLLYYKGHKTIWDIDSNALKLCNFNYQLNKFNDSEFHLECRNSLSQFEDSANSFDYVTMNPPFGSSTTITERSILDKFELGRGKKKQEIGVLFLELGLKLLKNNGIMFIIVPSGYVGNGNKICAEMRELLLNNRVIASIELPKNTFKRSGTGVNTYLLIIQKRIEPNASENYNIFISNTENIGYTLSKKETPIKYKIINSTGETICDENGFPILDNDFDKTIFQLSKFCIDNGVSNVNIHSITCDDTSYNMDYAYESVCRYDLSHNILDVKRYMNSYLSVVKKLEDLGATSLGKLGKIIKTSVKIVNTQKYKYIDISEINSPFYSFKDLYGWEMPSRAKYALKKYDILISKLEGTMSYCIILDNNDNYIATNGVTVIRPNDMNCVYILMANLMKKDFVMQHNAHLTGSIMASLSDDDIAGFLVENKTVNIESTKNIINTLEQLQMLRNM